MMRKVRTVCGEFTSVSRARRDGTPYRNGWCLARFRDNATGNILSVKGRIPTYVRPNVPFKVDVSEGDAWRGIPQYWFVRAALTEQAQNPRRVLSTLLRTIPGIGPFKAHKLITTLEATRNSTKDTLDALLSKYATRYEQVKDDAVAWARVLKEEMAPMCSIGPKLAEKVLAAWQNERGMRVVFQFTHWLKQIGMHDKDSNALMRKLERLCRKESLTIGNACETLRKHPYLLVLCLNQDFAYLDWRLHMLNGKHGIVFNANAPGRYAACLMTLLHLALDDHMRVPYDRLVQRVVAELNKRGTVHMADFLKFVQRGMVSWLDRLKKGDDATLRALSSSMDTLVFCKANSVVYVTTQRRWMVESLMHRHLRKLGLRTKRDPPVATGTLLKSTRQRIAHAFESHVGAAPTESQVRVIAHMMRSPLTLLQGYPGTGKSTVVGVLCTLLQSAQFVKDTVVSHGDDDPMDIDVVGSHASRNIEIHLLAPTGMAARRLGEAAGDANLGKTLHMAIYALDAEAKRDEEKVDEPFFATGLERTFIVIDEMSMVNSLIFQLFLSRLDDVAKQQSLYQTQNVHLILVGDSKQLPPIGAGLPFHNLLAHAHPDAVHTLTQVHRTANDPTRHLATLADRLRTLPYKDVQRTNVKTWLHGIPPQSAAFRLVDLDTHYDAALDLVTAYIKKKGYKADDLHFQVICPRTAEATQWNDVLKQLMNPHVADKNATVFCPKFRKETIQRGDRVIFVKNHYDKDLRNGCVGVVQNVRLEDEGKHTVVTVRFQALRTGEAYSDVDLSTRDTISANSRGPTLKDDNDDDDSNAVTELSQLHLAYAISVHKAQGGQYDDLIVYTGPGPAGNGRFYNRPLLYTGFTRGKKHVQVIGPARKLDAMLRRPLPPRLTLLSLWLTHATTPRFVAPNTYVFE